MAAAGSARLSPQGVSFLLIFEALVLSYNCVWHMHGGQSCCLSLFHLILEAGSQSNPGFTYVTSQLVLGIPSLPSKTGITVSCSTHPTVTWVLGLCTPSVLLT